jgi:hypothetical protein
MDPFMSQFLQPSAPRSLVHIYRSLRHPTGGTKRRFGVAGLSNILLTNGALQLMLHHHVPVMTATLVAQIFNGVYGYISYGKIAFRSSLLNGTTLARYSLMATGLWLSNWAGIQLFVQQGIPKSVGALLMIPLLAISSFVVQSAWVFAK